MGQSELYWKKEYEGVRNSWTYRIGSYITFVPRTALKFVKCIRKHGLVYTFTISLHEFKEGRTID